MFLKGIAKKIASWKLINIVVVVMQCVNVGIRWTRLVKETKSPGIQGNKPFFHYSKTCVKRPLKNTQNKDLMTNGSLMKVERIVE